MAGTIVNILVGVGSAAIVVGVVASRIRRRRKNSGQCGGCGCAEYCPSNHSEDTACCCSAGVERGEGK